MALQVRCLPFYLATCVQSLDGTWWKERLGSHWLLSGFHGCAAALSSLHINPHMAPSVQNSFSPEGEKSPGTTDSGL